MKLVRTWLVLSCLLLASNMAFSQTIQNVWKKTYLTNQNGFPGLSERDANSEWVIESISGSTDVRIKHVRSGLYLHSETDATTPILGPIQPGWWSAMWVLEPVAGKADQFRIKNKYRNNYLHAETSTIQTGAIQPGWLSALWNIPRERLANDYTRNSLASTIITVANRAGYSATVTISYVLPAYQPDDQGNKHHEARSYVMTKQIAFTEEAYVFFPAVAVDIQVSAEGIACTDPLDLNVSFANTAAIGGEKCYQLWGTLFGTEWAEVDCSSVSPVDGDVRLGDAAFDNFFLGEPKKTGLTGGYVSVFNQAGYVAKVSAIYLLPPGAADEAGQIASQLRTISKSEDIALGSTWKMSVPTGAISVMVTVSGIACLDPLDMSVTFPTAKEANNCYKLWGTIFDTEWGPINCN